MCVLSYIPTDNQGFILTNNRDESTVRPKAIPPQKYMIEGKRVFYPKDVQAGGTWIATSNDLTVCLLNGSLEKHISTPPYRQSRGQIILDFFKFDTLDNFIQNTAFEGIENFTLIIIHTKNNLQIWEFRWDGKQISCQYKDPNQAHIWSSSTLYSPQIQRQREDWFADFLKHHPTFTKHQIIDFHLHGGTGDAHNDMRINRNNQLVTQCIFQVVRQNQFLSFSFHDLLSEQELRYRVL